MKFTISSTEEMAALATKIASSAKKGDIFGLVGSLGVGKTFFASSFINSLQDKKDDILSPTFNLVYSYQTKLGEVSHFDLYRLKNENELENIGFFEALENSITLIEWPQISQKFLRKNYTEIKITSGESKEDRVVVVRKFS